MTLGHAWEPCTHVPRPAPPKHWRYRSASSRAPSSVPTTHSRTRPTSERPILSKIWESGNAVSYFLKIMLTQRWFKSLFMFLAPQKSRSKHSGHHSEILGITGIRDDMIWAWVQVLLFPLCDFCQVTWPRSFHFLICNKWVILLTSLVWHGIK